MKLLPSMLKAVTLLLTLFSLMFCSRYLKLLGFRSLARTCSSTLGCTHDYLALCHMNKMLSQQEEQMTRTRS